MKNTLMFLLVSLLLAFSLTACGGDSQQTGTAGSSHAANQDSGITGDNTVKGTPGANYYITVNNNTPCVN